MARRRDLRPEEKALWKQVADRTTPLHPARRAAQTQPDSAPKPAPKPRIETPATDLSGFSLGGKSAARPETRLTRPSVSESLSQQPVRMDARAFGRMKRGKLTVDGRIDLHGLTLEEAHPRLMAFLHHAHLDGKRLVLVITGKGRDRDEGAPIPVRRGILRHQVPQWLRSGSMAGLVLQITDAHRRHGGTGAFYVYLRRK